MAEKCTKTSWPLSCSMKPNPFAALNHFTVPCNTFTAPLHLASVFGWPFHDTVPGSVPGSLLFAPPETKKTALPGEDCAVRFYTFLTAANRYYTMTTLYTVFFTERQEKFFQRRSQRAGLVDGITIDAFQGCPYCKMHGRFPADFLAGSASRAVFWQKIEGSSCFVARNT